MHVRLISAETMYEWIDQIMTVLKESVDDQYDEDDDEELAGPTTELEIWKGRMAKFNAIKEQIKSRDCKIVLGVLQAAKSDVLLEWRELDAKLTDAANEAKVTIDNCHIRLT